MTKSETRARARARRQSAFDSDARLGGPALEAATDRLLALAQTLPEGPVAGYLPIRSELDPRPAMTALHWAGRPIAVPVIDGAARPLGFHLWTPETALVPGPFGTLRPATAAPVTPRLLIVPLLAFDAGGTRLGYGGGYYDRTLARLRAADAATRAVGFAFAAQEVPKLPATATDARLDALVTEAETLLWPAP